MKVEVGVLSWWSGAELLANGENSIASAGGAVPPVGGVKLEADQARIWAIQFSASFTGPESGKYNVPESRNVACVRVK